VNAIAANSGLLEAKIDMHVLDGSGSPVYGGNHTAEISVQNDVAAYTIDLSPGVKPSGYDKVLTYTCGARGGCGSATPPPGLLAGTDISDCSDTQTIVKAAPAQFIDVTCPDGKGLCTYVDVWNVSGEDNILYFSSKSGTQRDFPDMWNVPALGPYAASAPDQVLFDAQGNPIYPTFTHTTDAIAAAANPAQSSNAGVQSDRTACSDVHSEAYYQNV